MAIHIVFVKMQVGIDDLAIYVPKLYVDFKDFAEARGIAPQKLEYGICLLYTSPSPRDPKTSRMPSSA